MKKTQDLAELKREFMKKEMPELYDFLSKSLTLEEKKWLVLRSNWKNFTNIIIWYFETRAKFGFDEKDEQMTEEKMAELQKEIAVN